MSSIMKCVFTFLLSPTQIHWNATGGLDFEERGRRSGGRKGRGRNNYAAAVDIFPIQLLQAICTLESLPHAITQSLPPTHLKNYWRQSSDTIKMIPMGISTTAKERKNKACMPGMGSASHQQTLDGSIIQVAHKA